MKRLAKFFFISILLTSIQALASSGGGHGGAATAPVKSQKFKGNFTEEEMENMRLQTYLQNIASTNPTVAEFAVYYFERRGEKTVSPLINLLKQNSDDEKIVSAVVYTFGRMGPSASRAVPAITKYLDSENPDIRKTTISALGKIGKESEVAIPQISRFLDDENEWTRIIALRSLKEIGTPQSKAIANIYEKKAKLEEERRNRELLEKNGEVVAPSSVDSAQPVEATQPQPTQPEPKN